MDPYHSIFYLPPHPKTKLLFEARKVIPSSCPLKSVMGRAGCVFLLSFCFIPVYTCGLHDLQES